MSANDKQVGGSHYKTNIEPWDAILDWGLGYLDGSAVKYLSRWHKKGGVQDLEKAVHFLQKLIEVENARLFGTLNSQEQTGQTVASIVAESEARYGKRVDTNADYRTQVIAELHRRNDTGFGQPTSLGEIT
jgi:hypothetical protein